ncbi:MAG: hypothetical protein ABI823_10590 [Bryobacteraceae bacterium]
MPDNADTIARALFEEYFFAWNNADNPGIRKVTNFPFVALRPGGGVIVNAQPDDFLVDFPQMTRQEGWHHSKLVSVEVLNADAPDKILCLVSYTRHKQNGGRYMTGRTFYLLSKVHERWGIQVRWTMSQTA